MILSGIQDGTAGRLLYFSADAQRNDLGRLLARPDAQVRIHACGPNRMLDAAQQACQHWPEDALRVEHFSSTGAKLDPSKEWSFEVTLKSSGLILRVLADQTVLAVLRASNIDLPSDCEGRPVRLMRSPGAGG